MTMGNSKTNDFKVFIGKTISDVDDSFWNAVVFKFTDGQELTVTAECGTGPFDIPFLEISEQI